MAPRNKRDMISKPRQFFKLMIKISILVSFLTMIFVPVELRGQGASFGGKKLTQIVDLGGGGITTPFGNYSTISKVQLAGESVVFSAYGGENLDELAILSADGEAVVPLLELGSDALAEVVSLRLGDFRYLGNGDTLKIPVMTQTRNDFPRLMFFSSGVLSEVAGPSTIIPGTLADHFTQYLGVVAYDDRIAFIGVSTNGKRGVYLASEGAIHDLGETVNQEEQFPGSGIQDRLIFDGTTVYFYYQGEDEEASKDLYGSTLNDGPFLMAAGVGVVDDGGVLRSYQAREAFGGRSGEVIFLAEIDDPSSQSQWAFLEATGSGLTVAARSSSLSPVDGKSLGLSAFWDSFYDGESSYLGGVSQVFEVGSSPALVSKLQVFQGSPPIFLADIELGKAALVEASSTPKRIWAELGIVGPVEIPVPPGSQVVDDGGTAVFKVVAEGQGPFTYQWFLNGEFLPLSTTDALTVRRVSIDNAGSVRVVVSNEIDFQEAFASLDVSLPPEVILEPSDREAVAGESIEVLFQVRGQRPITYEFVEAPEGSSLEIAPIQSGEVFGIHAVKSESLTLSDAGRYILRASSPAGFVDFSFSLSVGGIPRNPQFRGKSFNFLLDHHSAVFHSFPRGLSFTGPVVFDDENDRFLTSPLVDSGHSLFAISSDGTAEQILDGAALEGIENPIVIGFLASYGIIIQGTQISQSRKALFAHKNGFTSTLASASRLQSALGFGPSFSRFEFKVQNGGIVGLVEGEGEWAVVRVDDEIHELVSSRDATLIGSPEGYLGCDEQSRPIFHSGFQPDPNNPSRSFDPIVYRVENNGILTTLVAGYLTPEQLDPSRSIFAIPSNSGVKYLSWGGRLIEILGNQLLVHQVARTRSGDAIFLPRMAEGYASRFRVFFPAIAIEDDLSSEQFLDLEFETRDSDSIHRKIFSWTVDGIDEVYSGRYLNGIRANAGELGQDSLKLLNVVGDQLLLSGQMESEGDRSFLMFNQARDTSSSILAFQWSRGDLYLNIPMGTRLQSNPSLAGNWTMVPSKAGSFVIRPNDAKFFYSVRPR